MHRRQCPNLLAHHLKDGIGTWRYHPRLPVFGASDNHNIDLSWSPTDPHHLVSRAGNLLVLFKTEPMKIIPVWFESREHGRPDQLP